ncbi:MAG: SDR family NAD(P)-dependent oxidoreductase [Acidobacteria bacterium]|nr:SDR family NAD(P)-dependent oxidoreductase [Acidobacteriota bacterium]
MLLLSLRLRIEGSNIFLTGASSGIGAALAVSLTRRGARVAAVSRRSVSSVSVSVCADLGSGQERARAVEETLSALGRVDILINNAGIGVYAPSWRTPMNELREMFEVNFFAAVDLAQRLTPGMVERRSGMVVNIASIASKVTLPWFTLYSASKAALEAFTRGLRIELAGEGVGAMLVCPGYVRTNFQASVLGGKPPAKLVSGKRFAATAEDVAEAIADGIERDARTVLTPAIGWGLVAAARLAPGLVDARLRGMMEAAGDE